MWLRVRQIALVANKLAPIVDDMKNVLGLEVCFRDPGVKVFGLENALFPVGNQFLEVVAPIQENTAGGRYLQRRKGDGGYMCILQCEDHGPVKERVAKLEHPQSHRSRHRALPQHAASSARHRRHFSRNRSSARRRSARWAMGAGRKRTGNRRCAPTSYARSRAWKSSRPNPTRSRSDGPRFSTCR